MLPACVPVIRALLTTILLAIVIAASSTLRAADPDPAAGGLPDLSDYTGKVVVLDFWASWCVPCRRSFPWLNSMHAKYAGDGLVIIAVNLDADRGAAQKFLGEYPADFQVVYDPDAKLAKQYDVIAMPSSLVFGRSGELLAHHNGFRVKQQDDYEAVIVAALAAN